MGNEEKNNLKNDKKKDNKVLRIVLKIFFLIAVAVVIISVCILTYKVIIVKKIMDNNVDVYLGNNYKIIKNRTYNNGSELDEILYYKDGKIKHVVGGKTRAIKDGEYLYMISEEEKSYYVLSNDGSAFFTYSENANLLLNWLVDKNDIDSYFDVLKFVALGGINIKNEVVDGKEYIVMGDKNNDSINQYINKETYLIEMGAGNTQKVEIGTVVDEDFVMPWDLGFTEIKVENN